MSITPAFSPGPWMTHGASVGSVRRWIFEDLYEQCSFHIAEKTPSSVKLGVRPINFSMRAYSSGLRPWAATSAGVIAGVLEVPARSFIWEALVSRWRCLGGPRHEQNGLPRLAEQSLMATVPQELMLTPPAGSGRPSPRTA